jgi:hypothetical protein
MTVQDVTYRNPDLIGATDAIATASDRVAVASPASGRVIQLRFYPTESEIAVEAVTAVLDPAPAYVQRSNDYLYVLGNWSPSANGRLWQFLIDSPQVILATVEDPEMGGFLYADETLPVILHGRTKTTGMIVARDPITLDELNAITVGCIPSHVMVDVANPTVIYVFNNDDAQVRVVNWNNATEEFTITQVFTLPRGQRIRDITSVAGVFYYVTGENFCVFDTLNETLVISYHDYYQKFRSVAALSDVIDSSADYLFGIDKAKRQVDRSREFRDPAFRRHLFGHFQQLLGTEQAPFYQVSTAKPRSVLRRLSSRTFTFDPTTGTLTWSAVQTFRYRGWSGNSDAEVQADDDVTVTAGEQVSYDVSAENRLLWIGNPAWVLDPVGDFKDRAARFDGETAFTSDTEVVAFTGPQLTLLAWIQPTSGTPAATPMTVVAAATALDEGWEMRITGTSISFYKNSQLYLTSVVANLYDGAWHQVGVILTSTTVRTVRDGVLSATSPIPAPLPPAAPAEAFFLGLIADIQVYTDARSSAYISDLFAKGPRG